MAKAKILLVAAIAIASIGCTKSSPNHGNVAGLRPALAEQASKACASVYTAGFKCGEISITLHSFWLASAIVAQELPTANIKMLPTSLTAKGWLPQPSSSDRYCKQFWRLTTSGANTIETLAIDNAPNNGCGEVEAN